MSAVRMCDRCGTISPEGVEGSTVGMVNRTRRNSDGRTITEQVQRDECPTCAEGTPMPSFPAPPAQKAIRHTRVDDDE